MRDEFREKKSVFFNRRKIVKKFGSRAYHIRWNYSRREFSTFRFGLGISFFLQFKFKCAYICARMFVIAIHHSAKIKWIGYDATGGFFGWPHILLANIFELTMFNIKAVAKPLMPLYSYLFLYCCCDLCHIHFWHSKNVWFLMMIDWNQPEMTKHLHYINIRFCSLHFPKNRSGFRILHPAFNLQFFAFVLCAFGEIAACLNKIIFI